MSSAGDGAPRSILVTGADGFVGRHLVAELGRRHPDAVLHATPFELTDPVAVAEAVARARPDRCLHLAAVSAIGEAREDPDRCFRINLLGTLSLARALRSAVPECLLVHVSSADVYGGSFRAGLPVDEGAPMAPLNTYAASKAASELALRAMAAEGGLRLLTLRPFNHTGAGQRDAFVVASFARQIARIEAGLQEPVLRVGALDGARDFLDVRDVVRAYADCLSCDLAQASVLNVASGVSRRIGDVLDELLRISGVRAEIETERSRLRPTDIAVAAGDAGALRRAVGWSPSIGWEDTLRAVLDDWRARVR